MTKYAVSVHYHCANPGLSYFLVRDKFEWAVGIQHLSTSAETSRYMRYSNISRSKHSYNVYLRFQLMWKVFDWHRYFLNWVHLFTLIHGEHLDVEIPEINVP